jgi:general stress protein 26
MSPITMNDRPNETADEQRHVADLLKPGATVMLVLADTRAVTSRPMTVALVDDSDIGMLVDDDASWFDMVADPATRVHLILSDTRANDFVSLDGSAAVTRDRDAIDRLWNIGASAFFEAKDDPSLVALTFTVTGGRYWDGPRGRLGSLVSLLRAAVAGNERSGEAGAVTTAGRD